MLKKLKKWINNLINTYVNQQKNSNKKTRKKTKCVKKNIHIFKLTFQLIFSNYYKPKKCVYIKKIQTWKVNNDKLMGEYETCKHTIK